MLFDAQDDTMHILYMHATNELSIPAGKSIKVTILSCVRKAIIIWSEYAWLGYGLIQLIPLFT